MVLAGDDKLSKGHADLRHHGERHPRARCKADYDGVLVIVIGGDCDDKNSREMQ